MVRVRFAPSPTGNLHIGTLRAALFNWLFARHHQGTFILRIEDTDMQRSDFAFEKSIFDGLTWLELSMDEGPLTGGAYAPYRQSERIEQGLYRRYAEKLIEKGSAYYCFCTEEELAEERNAAAAAGKPYVYSRKALTLSKEEVQRKLNAGEPYVVRFKIQDNRELTFSDVIRGDITFDLNLISDFVIMKSDGSPSYNFACVVDDMTMEITHVIRGEDHISNTPRQIALYDAFGVKTPVFAHLPMILGPDKSKLSKRHGATNVTDYRDMGYIAPAMLNYLALLGWTPEGGQEILSREEIIRQFSLDRISKSGAIFDAAKLTWMNGQYIRKLDREALYQAVSPYLDDSKLTMLKAFGTEQIKDIFVSVQDNLQVLRDINSHIDVYLYSMDEYKAKAASLPFPDGEQAVVKAFYKKLKSWELPFTQDTVRTLLEQLMAETGEGRGKLLKPLRKAASGAMSGPDLMAFLAIMGKDLVLRRLDFICSRFK